MRNPRSTALHLLILVCLLFAQASRAQTFDKGRLDAAWFGDASEWRQAGEIDYLWTRDGFSFDGRTVHIASWEEPTFLGKDRDTKDRARAFELTENMPQWLRGAFSSALSGKTEVSSEGGDLRLEGRFVDLNAGNNAAKWIVGYGAGSATATWDIRIVDVENGEVVAGIHQRSISGTYMSDIDDKILKWMDEALVPALRTGLGSVYASAKPVRK